MKVGLVTASTSCCSTDIPLDDWLHYSLAKFHSAHVPFTAECRPWPAFTASGRRHICSDACCRVFGQHHSVYPSLVFLATTTSLFATSFLLFVKPSCLNLLHYQKMCSVGSRDCRRRSANIHSRSKTSRPLSSSTGVEGLCHLRDTLSIPTTVTMGVGQSMKWLVFCKPGAMEVCLSLM